ncbi:hypothetical protein [Paracidovorax oryzae]|uniref:hypothetical protein n=1 Tax=Paracidovorax oryzae TaxID=862720 RepID=UPI0035CF4F8F
MGKALRQAARAADARRQRYAKSARRTGQIVEWSSTLADARKRSTQYALELQSLT